MHQSGALEPSGKFEIKLTRELILLCMNESAALLNPVAHNQSISGEGVNA